MDNVKHFFHHTVDIRRYKRYNEAIHGVPKKETKTGEDMTSKLGQLQPSMFRFLKAHLVDIDTCV